MYRKIVCFSLKYVSKKMSNSIIEICSFIVAGFISITINTIDATFMFIYLPLAKIIHIPWIEKYPSKRFVRKESLLRDVNIFNCWMLVLVK